MKEEIGQDSGDEPLLPDGPVNFYSGLFFIPNRCAPECIKIIRPNGVNAKVTWLCEAVLVIGSTVAINQAANLAAVWQACTLVAAGSAVTGWRLYNNHCLGAQATAQPNAEHSNGLG